MEAVSRVIVIDIAMVPTWLLDTKNYFLGMDSSLIRPADPSLAVGTVQVDQQFLINQIVPIGQLDRSHGCGSPSQDLNVDQIGTVHLSLDSIDVPHRLNSNLIDIVC